MSKIIDTPYALRYLSPIKYFYPKFLVQVVINSYLIYSYLQIYTKK